ncbi:MAG: ABC transporter permease subunit [Pseudomonadota bacterium]
MPDHPKFLGLHARPGKKLNWLLAALPFLLVVAVYLSASDARLEANPQDKLLPSVGQMKEAVVRMAFTEDRRSGEYLLWTDTVSSLKRLAIGVLSAAVAGLLLGLNIGLFRGFRGLANPFVTFVSMVPPLAILPILFITFGVGELGKVVLIFIGIFPVITRDVALATEKLPREQITKALTLDASQLAVVYRIVLPQILPRLLEAVRLSLGAAWLFLIAAEAIASTDGLGYRIFLVRRYLAMDVIIPYVLWITLLGFLLDWAIKSWLRWRYRWYQA